MQEFNYFFITPTSFLNWEIWEKKESSINHIIIIKVPHLL